MGADDVEPMTGVWHGTQQCGTQHRVALGSMEGLEGPRAVCCAQSEAVECSVHPDETRLAFVPDRYAPL